MQQQLLGEKLGTSTDANAFLRKLFLQHLSPNIRMVLVSTDTFMDFNWLTRLIKLRK